MAPRRRATTVYLSAALIGEQAGLACRDDGDWVVRSDHFDLTVLGDQTNSPRRTPPKKREASRRTKRTSPDRAIKDASRRDAVVFGHP